MSILTGAREERKLVFAVSSHFALTCMYVRQNHSCGTSTFVLCRPLTAPLQNAYHLPVSIRPLGGQVDPLRLQQDSPALVSSPVNGGRQKKSSELAHGGLCVRAARGNAVHDLIFLLFFKFQRCCGPQIKAAVKTT